LEWLGALVKASVRFADYTAGDWAKAAGIVVVVTAAGVIIY
jgi:hypothetical protein